MKVIVLFVVCLSVASAEDGVEAEVCSSDVCKIDDDCRCSSSVTPLTDGIAPQLISLTFDEAVTDDLYNGYWEPLLFSRLNPDKAPIGATFFVPHEYTDYERVNDLYNTGFEIGVHSITKNNLQEYWRSASEELLEQEFGGQTEILSTFANIPKSDIYGVRTPQLQLAGNYSIRAFVKSNLIYDSSWPTLPAKPLFPYTLDYLTSQQCSLGAECPNESFKGFWIAPIVDLKGNKSVECNTLSACNIEGTVNEIATWLLGEINTVRKGSRVPLTLIVESHWFEKTKNSLEAFTKVLDELAGMDDVFFVTLKQAIDWVKNPVPLADFKTDIPDRNANCHPVTCKLKNAKGEDRYMKSCIPCPDAYPWLGNPTGEAKKNY